MPKVSVIIPLYNGKKYILETLNSVLNQTFKDFEVIVIDDGSKDNSKEVLEKYLDRIRYIYQENSGSPAAAKNRGIKESKGEFLAFMDQDDLWQADKLAKQVKILEKDQKIGLVATNTLVFDSQTKEIKGKAWAKVSKMSAEQTRKRLLQGNFIVTSSAVMVRKETIEGKGFDENMRLADDYELWFRIAKKWQLEFIEEPLTKWRHNVSSLSHSHKKLLEDLVYFFGSAVQDKGLKDNEIKIAREQLKLFSVRLGNLNLSLGEYSKAEQMYKQAIDLGDGRFLIKTFYFLSKRFGWLGKLLTGMKLRVTHPVMMPTLGIEI
jgi:glycosyltransferase involved in cell wall biosynthesis